MPASAEGRTLPARWSQRWAAGGAEPALVEGESGVVTTAAQLEDASAAAALQLRVLGLQPGDRVLWAPASTVASVVEAVGVLRSGLVLVPVNPALSPGELRHVLGESRPAVCLTGDAAFRQRLGDTGASLPVLGARSQGGAGSAFRLVQPSGGDPLPSPPTGAAPELDACQPEDAALILFTSGTTGAPKGAVHSHGSLLANVEALRQAWHWDAEDRLLHALPLFHAHGLCVGLLGTLHAGASAVLLPRFGPQEVADAVGRFGGTLFFGVPTMYHRLVSSGHAGELSSLRLAVAGSAPLATALHAAMAGAGVNVLERYGTTETLMTLSNPYEGERRAGSVGLPLPGVEIRLAPREADDDDDGGAPRPAGAPPAGELLVRSPSVFAGYFGHAEATEAAFDDGWYRTGDVVSVASDGYVSVLGRTKELVISGGFNVYPAEVERVLETHPAVAEVAVTGTPSEEWGEVVTAWVVPRDGAGEGLAASLQRHAEERLAPYKRPRIIRLVDALPRNALGKVQRHRLGSQPSGAG